jgi:hypothetical protein
MVTHKELDDDKENKKAYKESCESGEPGETQKESAYSRSEADYNDVEGQKTH